MSRMLSRALIGFILFAGLGVVLPAADAPPSQPPAKDGGVPIDQVAPGSPAAAAGLKAGDLILKVDDKAVTTRSALRDLLAQKSPGDTVTLAYRRDGKVQDVKVK